MEFNEALQNALVANNGQVTLQQATDLLPNHAKHQVMRFLNGARNGGFCKYTVRVQDGRGEVIITSPNSQAVK